MQNRKDWLRGLDSNQDNQLQRLACYRLHYPGIAKEQEAIASLNCSANMNSIAGTDRAVTM